MLGYALGLWSEDERSDRDAFVSVSSVAGRKFPLNSGDNYGVPYDYASVMHRHERVREIVY